MPAARLRRLMPVTPVFLVDLFPQLHAELMTLLRGLRPGGLGPTDRLCALVGQRHRRLTCSTAPCAGSRSGGTGMEPAPDRPITSYADLVGYLNRLNAEWVRAAARRLSPRVLIELLDLTEPALSRYFRSLDPHAPARFGVAWAGEDTLAQLVRYRPGVHRAMAAPAADPRGGRSRRPDQPNGSTRRWTSSFGPCPSPIARSRPSRGRSVRIEIQGEAGGAWTLKRTPEAGASSPAREASPAAQVSLDQDIAWKLFSKGLPPGRPGKASSIEGDLRLGQPLLGALAIWPVDSCGSYLARQGRSSDSAFTPGRLSLTLTNRLFDNQETPDCRGQAVR